MFLIPVQNCRSSSGEDSIVQADRKVLKRMNARTVLRLYSPSAGAAFMNTRKTPGFLVIYLSDHNLFYWAALWSLIASVKTGIS